MLASDYNKTLHAALAAIKAEGRYRTFAEVTRRAGAFPAALLHKNNTAHPISIWCSNDYLGMGQHPAVLGAMHTALDTYGAGSGGTRNISGTTHAHVLLERTLASLHGKEAALVFTSGYVANEAALSSLGKAFPDMYLSDACNHASMINGMRQSGAERRIFRHNDTAHLQALLEQQPLTRPKIIAFESVYSMEGDIAPIGDIIALAKRFNALTYLDEVHAVGLYGAHGGGVAQQQQLDTDIDIIQGTLGKAYGIQGGYIAGDAALVDYVRSTAAGFIFSTSMPPVVAAGALASVQFLRDQGQPLRAAHHQTVQRLKHKLSAAGIPVKPGNSHIIPIMVSGAARCKAVCDALLEQGFYVQPINYPTVARGAERLRITVSPNHTEAMLDAFVDALHKALAQTAILEVA